MESKVGRMSSGFYMLMTDEEQPERLAYLWQRELFRDVPHTPDRLHLELYEAWNYELWGRLFGDLTTVADKVERLREYLSDGEITLRRLQKSPSGKMRQVIYDGDHIQLKTPPEHTEQMEVGTVTFPRSLFWSNLVIKDRL